MRQRSQIDVPTGRAPGPSPFRGSPPTARSCAGPRRHACVRVAENRPRHSAEAGGGSSARRGVVQHARRIDVSHGTRLRVHPFGAITCWGCDRCSSREGRPWHAGDIKGAPSPSPRGVSRGSTSDNAMLSGTQDRISADLRAALDQPGVVEGRIPHHRSRNWSVAHDGDVQRRSAQRIRPLHQSAAETLDTYRHLWPDSDDRTREAVDAVLGTRADSLRNCEALTCAAPQVRWGARDGLACRPGSVPPYGGGDHPSTTTVAGRLQRSTRVLGRAALERTRARCLPELG